MLLSSPIQERDTQQYLENNGVPRVTSTPRVKQRRKVRRTQQQQQQQLQQQQQ